MFQKIRLTFPAAAGTASTTAARGHALREPRVRPGRATRGPALRESRVLASTC